MPLAFKAQDSPLTIASILPSGTAILSYKVIAALLLTDCKLKITPAVLTVDVTTPVAYILLSASRATMVLAVLASVASLVIVTLPVLVSTDK